MLMGQLANPSRPGTPPSVYVVDDDAGIRDALDRLLRSAGYSVIVCASADEFLERFRLDALACLVLDVRLPETSGLELQERLAERNANLPIVFISAHGDIAMSVRAIKSGAVEFLSKPFSDEALLVAVEQALDSAQRTWSARADLQAMRDHYALLTRRERQVFELVARGLLNKQIGHELDIAEKTVKIHRGHVMQKMQAGSLAELVRMADRVNARPRPV
jgi:FixJ family two-component response regulator